MTSNISTSPTPSHRDPQRLARQRYDVMIIGGGINGAGIARDLASRGLRVALADKGDFASGTSSASTKLIHGGLRYLERFDLRLVFESCRERQILQDIAPHLVHPLPFFIPVYKDDPRSLLTIRAGMTLYDLLSLFRNNRHHSILSAAAGLEREPALRETDLKGVGLYWDCRMDDARLCLENILAAREAGAEVFNYLEATGLCKEGDRVRGVRLRDLETGEELEVEAEVVINAAGPWLDRICALNGETGHKLRPTRGTHILVPRLTSGREALYLTAGRDDRLFFVVPWRNLSLIGTTDVDDRGDPDNVAASAEDVDYLLTETSRHLRTPRLGREDIVATFSGLRPLVDNSGEPKSRVSRLSREHRIFQSASGLISIGGGKYTTYRSVAAETAALVCDRLGTGRGRSITHRIPLPGGATGNFPAFVRRLLPELSAEYGLPPARLESLLRLYGSRTPRVLSLLRDDPGLIRPVVEGSPLLSLQVAYAVDYELARTPEDVLRRRTQRALDRGRGLAELPAVAALMGRRLQVPSGRIDQWQNDYRRRYSHPIKTSTS